MRLYAAVFFIIFFVCSSSTPQAFAQANVTPTPTQTSEVPTQSGSNILNSFISGFDWISSGLIFSTPLLMDSTIKFQDGTELTGMSTFRNIFYDIAIPLFVLITSFVAFSHISNDNSAQLQQFFKRMLLIIALFIITPAILSYSIQFINLLNEKIIGSNSFNLSNLVNNFLSGFTEIPVFQQQSIFLPNWNTVLQLLLFIISIGFLLIGFIYIVFQAVIRFIALLVLSVIFPIVLPFALSEKTENIANTYFRTWFSFLIQQPAFVLGFAIVSTLLASISQAHNNSVGTLFLYSGALLFLGGINVFIGRIFGEGWSLMTTNAQSIIAASTVNKGARGFVQNEKVKRVPAYAGKTIVGTVKTFTKGLKRIVGSKSRNADPKESKEKIETIRRKLVDQKSDSMNLKNNSSSSTRQEINTATHTTNAQNIKQDNRVGHKQSDKSDYKKDLANNKNESTKDTQKSITPKKSGITTRRESSIKPVSLKRPDVKKQSLEREKPVKKVPRRKI